MAVGLREWELVPDSDLGCSAGIDYAMLYYTGQCRPNARGYTVTIYMNLTNRRVHALKYSEERYLCDYEWFDTIDQALAWLDRPL